MVWSRRRSCLPALVLAALALPYGIEAQSAGTACRIAVPGEVDLQVEGGPQAELFCPLVADPHETLSFVSFIAGRFPTLSSLGYDTQFGSVGLGESFSFVRWAGASEGDGVELGLSGGVFAQFDLRSPSFDLINADYVIGVPLTIRRSGVSLRLRLYHQSSHMGDEFVIRVDSLDVGAEAEELGDGFLDFADERGASTAFDFEALDILVSRDFGLLRFYGGGEWLFRRHPRTLDDLVAHGGAELRTVPIAGGRGVMAVDLRTREQYGWSPSLSVRAGLEFAQWRGADHPPRLWRVLLEYYGGPPPYGRSFQESLRWLGLGLHLSR